MSSDISLSELTTSDLYALLKPITIPPNASRARFINWGKTYQCRPLAVFEPVNELQCRYLIELAKREGKSLRPVGAGHSPSDLACTNAFMMRTGKLDRFIAVDIEKRTVVIEGGMSLDALHVHLADYGLAMSNVGSISDQSIAGVISTATHGTGTTFKSISTHVLELGMLLADGSRVVCSRCKNEDLFLATLCGLGITGLIVTVKLQVEAAFRLKETRDVIPFDECLDDLDMHAESAEHVRIWWFPQTNCVRLLKANRTSEAPQPQGNWFWDVLFGFYITQLLLFLGRYFGLLNAWTARLVFWLGGQHSTALDDSYKIFNLDCLFPQYTTEWAVPRDQAASCLREMNDFLKAEEANPRGLRPHFPIEIRFSAPDDTWLSPSVGQDSCWIGIVQFKPYGLPVPYRKLFARFENIMASHRGRPHWAKAHSLRPDDLRTLYPQFDRFSSLVSRLDPTGVLGNEYVRRHIFGETGKDVHGRVFKEKV